MENARALVIELGGFEYARFIPKRTWSFEVWSNQLLEEGRALWLAERSATHLFGVALPEETFYRGFLLTVFQSVWVPTTTVFGVRFGKAAIITNLFFALGHFIGEWNPLRFGPFFLDSFSHGCSTRPGPFGERRCFMRSQMFSGEVLALGYATSIGG